MNKSSEVFVS